MAQSVAPWLLATSIISASLAAVSVVLSLRVGSRFTQVQRWLRAQLLTKTSDARLARIEADVSELFSILGKVTTTTKRLSSRAGMQEVRERQKNAPPPPGASKSELRKHYGIVGLSGPDVARKILGMSPPEE